MKYGRLTILEVGEVYKKHRRVTAICECGVIKEYALSDLKIGNTKSCGCLRIDKSFRHGLYGTLLYRKWYSIMQRCYNPNNEAYANYGGRGILVCDEWHDVVVFYNWAIENGWKEGLQIDREENDGIYSPNNCRFVSGKANIMNRRNTLRLTHEGQTKTLVEWAIITGLPRKALNWRLHLGWSPYKILNTPL